MYSDALTYDPSSGKGGLKANFKIGKPENYKAYQPFLGLINEMRYKKETDEHVCLDKFSLSDYINTAALIIIRESDGPNMLTDINYGRKDV